MSSQLLVSHVSNTPFTFVKLESAYRRFKTEQLSRILLPLNPRNEKRQKLVRVHFGANFGVGLHFVQPFDEITVSLSKMMKNVAFVCPATIGHRFTPGEFPARFHIH